MSEGDKILCVVTKARFFYLAEEKREVDCFLQPFYEEEVVAIRVLGLILLLKSDLLAKYFLVSGTVFVQENSCTTVNRAFSYKEAKHGQSIQLFSSSVSS